MHELNVGNGLGLATQFDVDDPAAYDFCEAAALRAVSRTAQLLNCLCGRRAATHPGIVTYHRIAVPVRSLPAPLHNVAPQAFYAQLSGLLQRGFAAWPLERLLSHHHSGEPVPPRVFCVTFDDGFESVYSVAWPILQQLRIPATVFVNTAYLDRAEPFPFDAWGMRWWRHAPATTYQPLTWRQCHEMYETGLISFGAHTHTHEDFRGRAAAFREDLAACVDFLRGELGLHDVSFAFPFGSPQRGFAGPELVTAAKQTPVTCGLTTDPILVDLAADPFRWGRFNAFSWDTAGTLAAKLDGWYSWAPRAKRYLAGLGSHSIAAGRDPAGGGS